MRIRAVTLDLDDTLWPVLPALQHAERAVDDYLRAHHPQVARRWPIPALRELRTQVADAHPELAHDFTAQRHLTMRRAFAVCGIDEPPLDALWQVFARARNRVEPYPDALPALRRLAARLPVASLTNGNADLAMIGIHAHFACQINARDCGSAKPDPRIFVLAATRLGLPPAAILHVGDDPRLDVAGARDAGLHTAWINRARQPWPEALGAPPDLDLPDLAVLADWLHAQPGAADGAPC